MTTLSEARSQAEQTTAMPTRSSRRAAKRISEGNSGLRQRSSAHQNSHGQSPRRTWLAAASRSSSPVSPAMRPVSGSQNCSPADAPTTGAWSSSSCVSSASCAPPHAAHRWRTQYTAGCWAPGRRMTLRNCESVTP